MRLLEQCHVSAPRFLLTTLAEPAGMLAGLAFRTQEPVGPFHREGSARLTRQPPSNRVFPVRGVYQDLPDIVAPWRRPPARQCHAHAADRSAQVRPMP